MIPRLDFTKSQPSGLTTWQTSDGVVGASLHVPAVDIESSDEITALGNWASALAQWPLGIIGRLETSCDEGGDDPDTVCLLGARTEAVSEIGSKRYVTSLHLQTDRNPFLEMVYRTRHGLDASDLRVKTCTDALKRMITGLAPYTEQEISHLFDRGDSAWSIARRFIAKGETVLGIVRVFRPTQSALLPLNMAQLLAALPPPFRLTVNFKKSSKESTSVNLQRRLKQTAGVGKILSIKREAIESAIEETSLNGIEIFEYEVLLSLERKSEAELSTALTEAAGVLRSLGDVAIETVGIAPSFLATLPGAGLHVPMIEASHTLPLLLPIWRSGSDAPKILPSSLALHRKDHSIDVINLLDRRNQNSNALIVGSSGRGKSSFLGCLTDALLSDPKVRVIKVDVGGSHSKECELLNGQEYRLSLETTQGLNPFDLINYSTQPDDRNESVRSILGNFIEQLVLEEGELRIPKEVKSEIDDILKDLLQNDRNLSIDSVLKTDFSRKRLLSRWGKGGLYGKAFSSGLIDSEIRVHGIRQSPPRLRYFNFQDIFQASDQDFSQAAMAAVLAVFNLEMRLFPESRLVLICDETPFFIERCFEFFKLSTANVRKFGASVILVTQLSKHLIVRGDTGIIENSNHRVLFSVDGPPIEFQERMRLRAKDLDLLTTLSFQSGKFSEFLYQDGDHARAMRLILTPEEYWRITSSQSDRMKLLSLVKAVPGLSTKEAIRCLSVSAGR